MSTDPTSPATTMTDAEFLFRLEAAAAANRELAGWVRLTGAVETSARNIKRDAATLASELEHGLVSASRLYVWAERFAKHEAAIAQGEALLSELQMLEACTT